MATTPHRVVIVGAGFGGLEAAYRLAGAPVEITLIDRATIICSSRCSTRWRPPRSRPREIAWPIRHLMRDRPEVTTLLATVSGVDAERRRVLLDDGSAVPYDTLVLATGARHAYFGHDEWEPFAPGLKTLEDATTIRRRILLAFERAERETDPSRRAALLTFVIIGAGPTGVELAGTIAELAQRHAAARLPQHRHPQGAGGADRGGAARAGRLSPRPLGLCQRALERLGVEVVLGQAVTDCSRRRRRLRRQVLAAGTIIWAAGVRASPAAEWLGAPADRAGRVMVEPDLTVPGHPGDLRDRRHRDDRRPDGKPVPASRRPRSSRAATSPQSIKARLRGDDAAAVPLQACRQPGADRQAPGGDRFRPASSCAARSRGGSGASPTSTS